MRNTLLLAVFAALLQAAPQTPAQPPASPSSQPPRSAQPPVTFRVEVNYVEIDATVEDAQGNFVKNLTKDDFQIVEDVNLAVDVLHGPLFRQREWRA